ncbi:uncharacterized protein LOC119724468 isoform X2 [Patiria miniata]|uniref:TNFR-Cys domain-containing protein n=1 Tax=Patiria miniata TaxID=46514 RepID=A0A913ZKA0_PATMI|nr:uncharacterized protein LOC119724468 isoform X2 [Patiria miniata]
MGSEIMKLLPLFAIVFLISWNVMGVQAGERPAIFKKWPACKRDIEYVLVVKASDRRPGEQYNERHKNNKTWLYVCLPCTQCASGVRQLQPCTTYQDTNCSATECAVPGCVLDDMLHACRLPGDPNDFAGIAAMMDPCDPTKAPVNPTPVPSEEDTSNRPPQLVQSTASTPSTDPYVPTEPPATKSPSLRKEWGILETVLTVSLALLSLILAVGIFVHYRRPRRQLEKETPV